MSRFFLLAFFCSLFTLLASSAQSAELNLAPGSGDSLCSQIVADLNEVPQAERSVRLIHLAGLKLSSDLRQLVICLHRNSVRIEGTLVTAENYDRVVNDVEPDQKLHFFASPDSVGKDARRKNLLDWGKKLFGTPNGITFVEHMFRRGPVSEDSKLKLRFQEANDVFHRLASQSMVVGGVSMTASYAYANWGQRFNVLTNGSELLMNNVVMGGWVYLFTRFQREIMEFKKQGTQVEWDEFRPEGEQLVVRHNKLLFSGLSLSQELMISFMMVSVNAGPLNLSTGDAGNIAFGALAATYSYVPAEMALSKFLDRAQAAADRGDMAEHDRQIKRYTFWTKVWWWGVYCAIRNLPMVLPAAEHGSAWLVASLPLFATGTLGWFLDFKRDHPNFLKKVFGKSFDKTTSSKIQLADCEQQLRPSVFVY